MTGQRGFGAIAAIVVLVILAALSAAIVSVGSSQHMTSAQDIQSARAWQAARAGNEWGLYQALRNGSCVGGAGTTFAPDGGFYVTVKCVPSIYNEGELSPDSPQSVTIYQITSVACPAAICPATDATVAGAGYVERTRVVLATNLN